VIAPRWTVDSSVDERPDGSLLARGPDFAPVRGSAREAAERRLARAGGMGDRPRVVVLLGDEDVADGMLPVAEWVAASDVSADVLCVGGNDGQRRRAEVQSTRRVRILATAWRSDLPRLVADHDLVVASGHRFTWEVACIGTPMALLAIGASAAPGLEDVASAGAAIWLGRPGDPHSPAGRLRSALRDGMRRREVAATAARLVDGSGARRVAELLTR
jgi:spore coat polysaccharide biosynthesis predicted glycosyltransferase SpsG